VTKPVAVGRLAAVFRFPVKSMAGERLTSASLRHDGLAGDRLWALRDRDDDRITSAKRLPALLMCGARYLDFSSEDPDASAVEIAFPDGSKVKSGQDQVHQLLSDYLGRAVKLTRLPPASERQYFRTPPLTPSDIRQEFGLSAEDALPDLSSFPLSKLHELSKNATMPGTHFDAYPIHVLTTSTLAALTRSEPDADFDVRRFRPNLLIDGVESDEGCPEFDWCGGTLECGDAALSVEIPTVRCSMPARAQVGLKADPRVMRTVAHAQERHLGVYCSVIRAGRISVGDEVHFRAGALAPMSRWASQRARGVRKFLLRTLFP